MPNTYSGVCLTALFSAIVQEHSRLKDEADKIKAAVEALALPQPGLSTVRPAVRLPVGLVMGRS
ncbi:MAG: hypothetical protein FWG97_04605 [Deltaproteobacteria bacterium]|nr:hypothetical protein [Deltaproteobacteria bacterium]